MQPLPSLDGKVENPVLRQSLKVLGFTVHTPRAFALDVKRLEKVVLTTKKVVLFPIDLPTVAFRVTELIQ